MLSKRLVTSWRRRGRITSQRFYIAGRVLLKLSPILVANIFSRYAEILLQGDLIEVPLAQYPTLRGTSSGVHYNRLVITGATQVPPESQYKNELYRALYVTLSERIFLTSEWSPDLRGGRVDFFLKEVKWGIECVWEGDRLEEHICRFLKGGRY